MELSELTVYVLLMDKDGQNVHTFELQPGHRIVDVVLFDLCCYVRRRELDCVSESTKGATVFFYESDPLYVTLPSPPKAEVVQS